MQAAIMALDMNAEPATLSAAKGEITGLIVGTK